jgi:hypothetical protein
MGFKAEVNTFWSFVHGLFREPDGTPSVTRTLLILFSCFDVWVIWRIVYHLIHLKDPAIVGVWLANLPMLIGALIALTASPYAINRGTTTLSDLAGMIGKRPPQNDNVQKAADVVDQQITTRTTVATSTAAADPAKG